MRRIRLSIRRSGSLSVRRGFLAGALIGFSVAGSTLWGISAVAYLTGHAPVEPILQPHGLPIPRFSVPTELAWFFIQYPYVSASMSIRQKNRHTFIVSDGPRRREYVVRVGQQFRRVEIYRSDAPEERQVHLFTPGTKKIVWFQGAKVRGQSSVPDGNLWMWRSPLWNPVHLKIYGLADAWLDSPYKRYSCAGFAHRFLSEAGVRVPILDAWDLARQPWTRVTADEMEPGDLITIRAASRRHRRLWKHSVTHVGVYIGHGKMIHAATTARSTRAWVRITDVGDFQNRIDKILRPPELL